MNSFINKVKNVFVSIMSGRFMLDIGVHRLFPHILFFFTVCLCSIVMSFYADLTMAKREQKKKELEGAKIMFTSKLRERISLDRYTTVEDMLENQDSKLEPLRNPVIELK